MSEPPSALPAIKFHAHACVEIEYQGETMLCDPWFFGKIFNDSWELLVNSDSPNINYHKLKYIWISHEHPDHFHPPTLKYIAGLAKQPITALFQNQPNKNVVKALTKFGFEVVELDDEKTKHLPNGLKVTSYRHMSDTALVIQTHSHTILNHNDCRLSLKTARRFAERFGTIDLWLFQFSLAGHYANYDDTGGLTGAREAHFDMIRDYDKIFKARIFVPFASFITFCRDANNFLNGWAIRPSELLKMQDLHTKVQLVYNDDWILWDEGKIAERNELNAAKWDAAFDKPGSNDPAPAINIDDLVKVGSRFCESIRSTWPYLALPPKLYIRLTDQEQDALIDFHAGKLSLVQRTDRPVIADIDASSLLFLFRFPWGADTVHISSCFYVRNAFLWKWLTYIRHGEYKLEGKPMPFKFAPVVMSFLRTKMGMTWHRRTKVVNQAGAR